MVTLEVGYSNFSGKAGCCHDLKAALGRLHAIGCWDVRVMKEVCSWFKSQLMP